MDTPNDNSNAQGGTSQPLAGSARPQGETQCPQCGRYHGQPHAVWCNSWAIGERVGTAAEPEAAPRHGASALGPPATDSLAAEQREAANRVACMVAEELAARELKKAEWAAWRAEILKNVWPTQWTIERWAKREVAVHSAWQRKQYAWLKTMQAKGGPNAADHARPLGAVACGRLFEEPDGKPTNKIIRTKLRNNA